MNTSKLLSLILLAASSLYPLGAQAIASETSVFDSLFADGKPIVNVRLRVETVDQDGVKDATATTIRSRIGFQTAKIEGFQALVEMEDITALDYDSYNAAGLNGQAGRAVVLDPKTTELNRAWFSLSSDEAGSFKLGRQLVTFDDHRFIGHVGWRQNIQTFDAITYTTSFGEGSTISLAYLDEVHRILGDDHPAGDVDLDTILANASFAPAKGHKLTAFAYLLESDQLRGWSTDTFGIRATGAFNLGENDSKINYVFSYANQGDNGASPSGSSFNLDYIDLQAWTQVAGLTIGAGFESLEGNGTRGLSTPLATVHKFNGWADVFAGGSITGGLASGLEDTYLKFVYKLDVGKGLPVTVFYHWFDQEVTGNDLGTEFDLVTAYPFTKNLKGIFKYAYYDGGNSTIADRKKLWLELNFTY